MTETIIALATPPGRGGVAILRFSGHQETLAALAQRLTGQHLPKARLAAFRHFYHQEQILDQGLVLFFPAPHSFTGEAVLECQVHGSPVVLSALQEAALAMPGVRLALPGEFSERAFLNGKIDLNQAEAIADLIESQHLAAAQAAAQSLTGAFSARLAELQEKTLFLRAFLEATLDFSEEDGVPGLSLSAYQSHFAQLEDALASVLSEAQSSEKLLHKFKVVLAGAPNAGKSTLFNALLGESRALVSPVPGTTRDFLRETFYLAGNDLQLVDTAGLQATDDAIEAAGIAKSYELSQSADFLLWLVADRENLSEADLRCPLASQGQVLTIISKIDQTGRLAGWQSPKVLALSAHSGEGLALLREALAEGLLATQNPATFLARPRQIAGLQRAQRLLQQAKALVYPAQSEIIADFLRQGHEALGEILGETTSDAVLGEIFRRFCIGK
jgi:tRNA modification GTPase